MKEKLTEFDIIQKQNLDKLYQRTDFTKPVEKRAITIPEQGNIFPINTGEPMQQTPFESGLLDEIDYQLGYKVKKP